MTNLLRNTLLAAGGAVAGVIAGVLTAPRSGKETRERMKDKTHEYKVRAEILADKTKNKVEETANDLKSVLSPSEV